ncbi:MAG: sigma-70 family RNA polymerase sigma factor [Negativicutes bacterium]|nr:sigma-70 family RNA polymerase sigma factor [Negativicutes bacterium]
MPTRYSLLSRLQDWDDQASWRDFFDTYWRLIYSFALKSGLSEAEAQDAVQETVLSVAKNIHKFKRDPKLGSFKGWLRNLTRWRIADQLRKRNHPGAPMDSADDDSYARDMTEIAASPEAETIWDHEWRANLMDVAMGNVRRSVKEEHYQIFDLYVVKEWPAAKVARTLGVSIGQIYVAKFRVGALIRKEIRRLEESQLQIK